MLIKYFEVPPLSTAWIAFNLVLMDLTVDLHFFVALSGPVILLCDTTNYKLEVRMEMFYLTMHSIHFI